DLADEALRSVLSAEERDLLRWADAVTIAQRDVPDTKAFRLFKGFSGAFARREPDNPVAHRLIQAGCTSTFLGQGVQVRHHVQGLSPNGTSGAENDQSP